MTEGIYDLRTGEQVQQIEDVLISTINQLSTK